MWLNGQIPGAPYRLPSEAEWEYAARAETDTPYWTGATISREQANFDSSQTVPVGSLNAPNQFGLQDVHGNVWEWVEDCWHDNYSCAPVTSEYWLSEQQGEASRFLENLPATTGGNCSLRVLRGGSWSDGPRNLRSANRLRSEPVNRDRNFGFRLARTLTPGLFTSLPGVQGAEPPAENFWPSVRYEGSCLGPDFEPGDASDVFLSLGKGNRMRLRGGPAFFDSCAAMPSKRRHDRPAALAAQAYCRALGFEEVSDYEANDCEEDESAYAVFDETDQCWKLKNTGSKNGCYAVISSVTCSPSTASFGGGGVSSGGVF